MRGHKKAEVDRTCSIYGCSEGLFCRARCYRHYLDLRRYELEGRAAELQQAEPSRPRWEWPGDEKFLIDRLERDELNAHEEKHDE
jgi:hypothetical protein